MYLLSFMRFLPFRTLLFCLFILLVVACGGQGQKTNKNMEHAYTNHLIKESSPYLLQHAHNPVDWYPWGKEALDKARNENKLIIISIGYAACHWCHVMEHESFEDTIVAKIMNDHFVSIKVDREERPDVDNIYMNAAYLISGRGGWPLNAIALPDGRPVFAGTYFPNDDWIKVLNYYAGLYLSEKEKLINQANQISKGIAEIDEIPMNKNTPRFDAIELEEVFSKWAPNLDNKFGGRIGAPKFPMPVNFNYLLHYAHFAGNDHAMTAVETLLDNMAHGGINDHLGGGFARYSTDDIWKIPHFEKMLYDNAQLVSLYSKAWQATGKEDYKRVVEETLGFISKELTSPEGGFYSSLDADSEGEEGKFYTWTKQEIEEILGNQATAFETYYNITERGNWEHGKNALHRDIDIEALAKKLKRSVIDLESELTENRKKLFEAREKRIRPALDDKILTSWNALMIAGYVHAYRAIGNKEYLEAATKNAEFLVKKALKKGNRLTRNYKNGKSSINAFLDDYALLAEAFIELYQASFNEKWLFKAEDIVEHAIAHFYNEETGMFFYTSDLDEALIARKTETSDNVIPASNSVMAKVLYKLGMYLYKPDYIKMAEKQLNNMKPTVMDHANFYSNWADLMIWFIEEPFEIAIAGKDYALFMDTFGRQYLPNALFLGTDKSSKLELLKDKLVANKTLIYVCKDKTCQLPVTNVEAALLQMK